MYNNNLKIKKTFSKKEATEKVVIKIFNVKMKNRRAI
jgi:hypothetical protein